MNYDIKKFPLDLVLNILGIIILFVAVRFLVYKPVKKFLDARREKIEGKEKELEDEKNAVSALKEEYETKLKTAKSEAEKTASDIIARANKEAEQIVEDAKHRADTVLELAGEKLKAEREASKAEREHETVAMAFDIAEKILERKVNDSDTINMAQKLFRTLDENR